MLNLHDIAPEHFTEDEFPMIDLDAFYKYHSQHSHLTALEKIFAEGVKYTIDHAAIGSVSIEEALKKKHQKELDDLRNQFNLLQQKYEALLARAGVDIQTRPGEDQITQHELVNQTLGMGKVFQK
jgi:hypothetical protein